MPRKNLKKSVEPANGDVKKLFDDLLPDIPIVVRQVCANLGHRPQQTDLDDFVNGIVVRLKDKNYRRLRLFHHDSSPQTWLYSLAKRYIVKRLRRESKMISLEDFPPDSFISPPDQEERLISEEKKRRLLDAANKLPVGKKKLFDLLWDGKSDPEIAKALKIKKTSVWVIKSALKKKIREILRRDGKPD